MDKSENNSPEFSLIALLRKINILNAVILKIFIVSLFSAATGLYCLQLISRFFFQTSFFFIDSFIKYAFIVSAFYGVVLSVSNNEHIKIDLFKKIQTLPQFKLIFNGVCFLLSLCLLILYFQYTFFLNKQFVSHDFWIYFKNIPMVFLFFSMALSFSEVALTALFRMTKNNPHHPNHFEGVED